MGYRMIKLPSDEPVQYVGVYVRQWGDVVLGEVTRPRVGFIEDELMLSDDAVKVIDDWMDSHGFETRYLALQDILIEFKEQQKSLGELIQELDAAMKHGGV